MTWIRGLVVAIGTVITLIALLPMVVLLDLAAGGDGLGLCRGGLGECRTSYFDAPELVGVLGLVLLVLVVALRAALRADAAERRRREAATMGPSVSGRDRLGGG